MTLLLPVLPLFSPRSFPAKFDVAGFSTDKGDDLIRVLMRALGLDAVVNPGSSHLWSQVVSRGIGSSWCSPAVRAFGPTHGDALL
jgi:hypothetical protein